MIKVNGKGIRELLNSDMVKKDLERRGEKVKARANSNAPVDTGALAQSHEMITDNTDRARVRIYSNKEYAITVEANTGYLSESLDAAGDDE